jgi:hypothetical protein
MALFGSGNSAKYFRTGSIGQPDGLSASRRPIWVSVWTKGGVPAAAAGLASFGNSSASGASAGSYLDQLTNFYAWDRNSAGSFQQANATSSVSSTAWQHVFAYFTSSGQRILYYNGNSATDSNTLTGTQSFDSLVVGAITSASMAALNSTRLVGEVTFGVGAVGLTTITSLVNGANPLRVLPPWQILGYFPLRGDLNDYGPFKNALRPIGGATAVWGENAPVDQPRNRRSWITRLSTPSSGVSVTPGTGSLVLTGFAPTVSAGASVTPSAGSLALTGFAPTVAAAASVTPGVGTLTITGFAPTVTAGANVTPGRRLR